MPRLQVLPQNITNYTAKTKFSHYLNKFTRCSATPAWPFPGNFQSGWTMSVTAPLLPPSLLWPRATRRSCAARAAPDPGQQVQPGTATAQQSTSHSPQSQNPLEQLRVTTDPRRRSELLLQLDNCWSECEERYVPSPAEECLAKELGVGQSTILLAAVQVSPMQRCGFVN